MNRPPLLPIALVCVLFLSGERVSGAEPLSRILFGSCIKQEKPIPIFNAILKRDPELFLFLGDNIYADTDDMEVMRAKYETLRNHRDFSRFWSACPVMATWDDHDYGRNDGGADFPKRDEAQKEFLDFWKVPSNSPRRERPGVYYAATFGPKGKRVQIILLDTRYFRGPLKTGERRVGGQYYPDDNPDIPMLGEAQWEWLEDELRKPAEVRLLVSSIQCVPEAAGQETWSNLPKEKQRLFDLIAETGAEGVIILSGDRHWSELSVEKEGVPYPIYELTSSSLNQVHPRGTPTENRYRLSETTLHTENYGEVEIDWNPPGKLHLRIRDLENEVRIEQGLNLDQLRSKP